MKEVMHRVIAAPKLLIIDQIGLIGGSFGQGHTGVRQRWRKWLANANRQAIRNLGARSARGLRIVSMHDWPTRRATMR